MKKIAYMGLFGAVAIIFGYVESLFPVFAGIPGIKLGLANLVTVFILYTYSYREAALVSFIRILVIGFLFGNLFSILFSLAGAALSLACMTLAKKYLGLSIAGVIIVAALVVENVNLFYYFPALLIAGLITGFLIGILSGEILKRTSGRKLV